MDLVDRSDAAAFEIILERHSNAAFALAYRITERRSLAEVAVQEAFHAVWRSNKCSECIRWGVRNWILRDVRDRAIDLLRRDRASGPAADREPFDRAKMRGRTEVEQQAPENSDQLRAALDRLPADQAQTVELAYFDGFTHTEIAAMLDLPAGTVKGRMRLGLEHLTAHLLGQEAAT